jgi:hypothetical protein
MDRRINSFVVPATGRAIVTMGRMMMRCPGADA